MIDAKRKMQAKAAELAAMVKARYVSHEGAVNSIAAYSQELAPGTDYADAWKLYDYGIEQFRAWGHSGNSQ